MKFLKSEILPVLMTLAVYKDSQSTEPDKGLLTLKMSLGLRRRLQKIRNAMLEKQKELEADLKEITESFKPEFEKRLAEVGKEQAEAEINPKLQEETKVLFAEEFELDVEPVDIKMIEALETEENLDWTMIEKFAK